MHHVFLVFILSVIPVKNKTYSVGLGFSLKILRRNFPSSFGLNVEGMIAYSPGGSLWRPQTSLELMNVGDLAVDELYWKNSVSKVPLKLSGF